MVGLGKALSRATGAGAHSAASAMRHHPTRDCSTAQSPPYTIAFGVRTSTCGFRETHSDHSSSRWFVFSLVELLKFSTYTTMLSVTRFTSSLPTRAPFIGLSCPTGLAGPSRAVLSGCGESGLLASFLISEGEHSSFTTDLVFDAGFS